MKPPDAPPPSSSPPTTREAPTGHRRREGGLDPDPPDPGITLRTVAPHAVLVLSLLLAIIFSRGDMLLFVTTALLLASAWGAWLLARIDARHRPIAWGLVAMAACALVREGLHAAVLHGGPYAGWARVAFHIEEATRLTTAALPAWMALAALRKYPPGPTGRIASHGGLVLLSLIWFACVACYPDVRGDVLRKVYLSAELASLFVAAVAILSWVRRRGWRPVIFLPIEARDPQGATPREAAARAMVTPLWYTWAPILALVVGDLALLIWGAWRWGLFGDAYMVQQAGLVAAWGTVAAIHGAALALARRRR